MSIERCHRHDRSYDTDFETRCPHCDEDFDDDVAIADSMFVLPDTGRDHPFMEDKTILEDAP